MSNDPHWPEPEPTRCPDCQSEGWVCYNERTIFCWDTDGAYCGDMVIGYLRCMDCGARWTECAVDGSSDDCFCEE